MAVKVVQIEDYPYDKSTYDTNEYIGIQEVKVTYVQEPDCTEDRDGDFQEITLSTREGGGGFFLNIKTDNWSVNLDKGLTTLIEDFKSRIKNNTYE